MRTRVIATTVFVAAAVLLANIAGAQFRRIGDPSLDARRARPESFDGQFHYCRAMYRQNLNGDGGSWLTDYPLADIDLSIRLGELTKIRVSTDPGGQPNHLIVNLMDDELFQCPAIIMQEVGSLFFTPEEAARLRTYLLKGGFLWVDDFWGSYAWDVWASQIQKVFPPNEFPIVDLPMTHPIFHTMFNLDEIPQIPGIGQYWRSGGSDTSERGADSAEVHVRGIADRHGRIMVLMTHNTDVSDSWEREGEDPQYFYRFSVVGYRIAVNAILYAITH